MDALTISLIVASIITAFSGFHFTKWCIGILRCSNCMTNEDVEDLERRTGIDLDEDGKIA